jgi:flavin reductase (DIM6/NTAB) family NADH-FMN oxidoreductase RutF
MQYKEQLQYLLNNLQGKGVFLTSGMKPNTMTASWGFGGVMWDKPIIVAPVRPTRFTHDLIAQTKEFSISVPLDDKMNKLLGYFGSVSGRDVDKYKEKNITPVRCKSLDTFVMPNCLCFECKLIYTNNIVKERLDEGIKNGFYGDNAFHTMFYGEIIYVYNS